MEIRFAASDDIDELVHARLAFNEEIHPEAHNENEALAAQFRAYLPRAMENGAFMGVLGFVDGEVVSTVFMVIRDMPANSAMPYGRNGTLLNVFTYPQYRCRGYSEQVVEMTIAAARDLRLDVVDLEATAMGRGLYEKVGFAVRPLTPMRLRL